VNQIPVALVERIDVAHRGASSTYGADAVAGVVNFIMNDHFEGVRIDASQGIYNHDNYNKFINPLLAKRKFPTVSGSNWDGENKEITLIMGHNFADGAGQLRGLSRLPQSVADHGRSPRPRRVCAQRVVPRLPVHLRRLEQLGADRHLQPDRLQLRPGRPGRTLIPKYQRFNYAASHYLQRIDERYTAGFFGHLKFNAHVEAYTEVHVHGRLHPRQLRARGYLSFQWLCHNPPRKPGRGDSETATG